MTAVYVASNPSFDDLFLAMAKVMACKSKDPSTKVGCVIVSADRRVLSTGYNGFPQKINDAPERYADRATKYKLIEHADRNSIYSAARHGISLKGATMYVSAHPCHDCMRGIIQAGIVEVVWAANSPLEMDPEKAARWKESMASSQLLAEEAGIKMRSV